MNKFIALAVGGFVAFAASQASAAAYSVNNTFGPGKTDFTTTTLSLAAFDTTLGTLTSVLVALTATANVGGTVTNTSATAQNFKVTETTNVALSSGTASVNGVNVDLLSTQTYASLAPGATANFGPFVPNASASNAGTPLSAFIGSPITFTASTLTGTTILGGGGNITNAIGTTASGTVTLTYTYTPTPAPTPTTVPEPASMALLGMGLAGLGLIRRRSV